jgi:hypothetical protein
VIVVEPKDETRKRLGRSPDAGDAVVMSVWDEAPDRDDPDPDPDTGEGYVPPADTYEAGQATRRRERIAEELLELDDDEPRRGPHVLTRGCTVLVSYSAPTTLQVCSAIRVRWARTAGQSSDCSSTSRTAGSAAS